MIEVLAQAVYEFGIKGLGYVILRIFRLGSKKEVDFNSTPIIVTGILSWTVIVVIIIVALKQLPK